jgi:phage baseplate assembly protein W
MTTRLGFGTCMDVRDDLSPTGALARGVRVLINDIRHLLLTERGTCWTDLDFGLGLGSYTLQGVSPRGLPAIESDIQEALDEDDRIGAATVDVQMREGRLFVSIDVVPAEEPANGFRLVGYVTDLREELLSNARPS